MSAAQPELKSSDLLMEMNRLIVQTSIDSFTINRLKKEIAALKKVSPLDALVIQSGLLVLERDFDGAFDEAQKLLRQWPLNAWVVLNAEVTLNRIGRFTEQAQAVIDSALSVKSDKTLLQLALKTAYISGRLSKSVLIAEQLKRIGEATPLDEVHSMNAKTLACGVTDEHTQQIAELAYATLRNYKDGLFLGRAIHAVPEWMIDEFGEQWLVNRVYIPARHKDEWEDLFEINDAVCIGLAGAPFIGNPALSRFMVDFILEDSAA